MKIPNEYQALYPHYDQTPKAVIAAVAFSLAMRLTGDDAALSRAMVRDEWKVLHDQFIVPQEPPKA